MLRIRYSPGECEIAGTSADLRVIADLLHSVAYSGDSEEVAGCATFDPHPYCGVIPHLRAERDPEGKDRVTVAEDSVTLSASAEGLHRFASFFDFSDEATDGEHVHHDSLSGDPFVSPDSHPLIVAIDSANTKGPNQPVETTDTAARYPRLT